MSTASNTTVPNPGSPEAQSQGCTCPVMDNHCGRGCYDDGIHFWINYKCPLHGTALHGAGDKQNH